MEFSNRMRASMLIVMMFCVMCVSTVLTREETAAAAEAEQERNLYVSCETSY